MSGLNFVKTYGGQRIERSLELPPLFDAAGYGDDEADAEEERSVELGLELATEAWQAINPQLPASWRARDWAARPVRFVDGKDVGHTVACLRNRDGVRAVIRLAEIGSIVMRVVDGELRREIPPYVERVAVMDTTGFPWEEVESFAGALQAHGLRLLAAKPVPESQAIDWEQLRRQTQRRSAQEMSMLEEFALAQNNSLPTIVDGPLKSREGGFDALASPVFGVVKTFRLTYLHALGQQVLFDLEEGRRTPAFSFEYDTSQRSTGKQSRLPIVAWYVRLCGGLMPNYGLVRVEVSHKWFAAQGYITDNSLPERISAAGADFINQLSRTIYEYTVFL